MESRLKKPRRSPAAFALPSFFAALVLLSLPPRALASGKIWGRVMDGSGRPIAKAAVSLTAAAGGAAAESLTDGRGAFGFLSTAPGLYSLRARKAGVGTAETRRLTVSDASDINVEIVLKPDAEGAPGGMVAKVMDFSAVAAQTLITSDQIDKLPSGHSLASLIENQDLSATPNRIDVGGLWSNWPAVYSARGGVSWNQNVVLLNGLDISDPYDGGLPLWLPDVFSLASISHANAVFSARAPSPGGQLSLTPRSGTEKIQADIRLFYTDKSLSSNNITPALQAENLLASDAFSRASEYDVHVSGPVAGRGATFSTSWSQRSITRELAGFGREDSSSLLSGLFSLHIPAAANVLNILWAGQSAVFGSYGADRGIAWEATAKRSVLSSILQAVYETAPGGLHHSRFGLSWSFSRTGDELQPGAAGQPRRDIFTGASANAPAALEDGFRHKITLAFDGTSLFPGLGLTDHRLDYGAQIRWSSVDIRTTVPRNVVLGTYGDKASEAAFWDGPFRSRPSSLEVNASLQDSITIAGLIGLRFGLNASFLRAGNGTASVEWLNVSPRAELSIPFSLRKTSAFKIALARYDLQLPLSRLLWGDPGSPGALIHAWTDPNGDGVFEEAETGALLRREGPAFSAIDPGLKRPRLEEFVLSFVQDIGSGWRFTFSGFLRRTNRLLETINSGVTAGDYRPLTLRDIGDDRIPGSHDDLTFTVYDRLESALGRDFFLLTNPEAETRDSTYRGADLTLVKSWNGSFLLYLSMTAMEIIGTTNPGDTELQNDDGMIGPLYDDPNAAVNARGRMRFDRAYTIRLGLSAPLPLGARFAVVAKYYDGQPFARKIVVEGLRQGLLSIQAHARGVARYEFNMTVDGRLEKSVAVGRGGVLRFLVDAFNLFNQSLATEEDPWTGPDFPLRFATRVQSPRVVRAGIQFSF